MGTSDWSSGVCASDLSQWASARKRYGGPSKCRSASSARLLSLKCGKRCQFGPVLLLNCDRFERRRRNKKELMPARLTKERKNTLPPNKSHGEGQIPQFNHFTVFFSRSAQGP